MLCIHVALKFCVFDADWPIAVVLEACTGSWPAGFETLDFDTICSYVCANLPDPVRSFFEALLHVSRNLIRGGDSEAYIDYRLHGIKQGKQCCLELTQCSPTRAICCAHMLSTEGDFAIAHCI